MLRRGDEAQGGEAAAVVRLTARSVVGRPLAAAPDGSLALDAPIRLEIREGRVAAVERASAAASKSGPAGGDALGDASAVLAPALADAHVHLLACAAERAGLDLGSERPRSLAALLARLARAAGSVAAGSWLRASGYDEAWLAERRHPTRGELDLAVPQAPLRLRHATRHASLLNSLALRRVEQRLGRLDAERAPRDARGTALGVVYGLEPEITRIVGPLEPGAVRSGLAAVGAELVRYGVASLDELTASNDAARIGVLAGAVGEGILPLRVRAYVGDADEVEAARRAAAGRVEVVGVKLLARSTEEACSPAFRDRLARARRRGLPVAVHAVEPDVVSEVLFALAGAPPRAPVGSGRDALLDRLEHCSLCPPELVRRIAAARVAVVTQPAFLAARDVKYRAEVEPALWPWLYPLRSLRAAGVLVAAGSDAPVAGLDPRLGIRGALARGSGGASPVPLGRDESLDAAGALELLTVAPARLRGESITLRPAVGDRADLVVVEPPEGRPLGDWAVRHTLVGGQVVG